MEQMVVNDVSLVCKVYNGQRVVTLEDIDNVHNRVDGTARKRFNDNKKHLIENEDYYLIARKDLRPIFGLNSDKPLRDKYSCNASVASYTLKSDVLMKLYNISLLFA